MKNDSQVIVRPARNLRGSVRLPGDKSISHRYAMLAGIAEGPSRLENYSTGADCASTLGCMRALGVTWERQAAEISSQCRDAACRLPLPPRALDCGNSGSTMRMLSGIVAGQKFTSEMVGDESLSRRPMARVITPLSAMGAQIESHDGKPPLRITGAALKAIDYTMPVASAQVKSCLLFAGLFADGETRIEEPLRTRDHGEVALRAFGAKLDRKSSQAVNGKRSAHPRRAAPARHRSPHPGRPVERGIFSVRGGLVSGIATDCPQPADESHARPAARHPDADRTAHLGHATR